jgi:dTDP-4-dehydrorhamnose 3,5-epimerase
MSRFDIIATPLQGLQLLHRRALRDARGYLERMFCVTDLGELLGSRRIEQINRTLTKDRGVVRGLHFQMPPHAEMKFVSCLRGEVFDVAVDLRHGSPTFLQWYGEKLTGENGHTLCIPEGFAHGFQTLTEDCEMLYLHTKQYAAAAEGGLSPLEQRVAVRWPQPISSLSERDSSHAPLPPEYSGIRIEQQ